MASLVYKTLKESILSAEGLLGYYPVAVDAVDLTGNNPDLSFIDATFTDVILVEGSVGSGLTTVSEVGEVGGMFTLVQPLNVLSMEVWCKNDSLLPNDSTTRGVLSANLNVASATDPRIMFLVQPESTGCNFRVLDRVEVGVTPTSTMDLPQHIVIQYEALTDETVVYVSGVKTSTLSGNGFASLTSGGLLSCGGYSSLANTGQGGSYVSDFAFYDRELTLEEILWRVNQNEVKTDSIVDSVNPFYDGSLIAKYQLDVNSTDLLGGYHGTDNNVTYADGKFNGSAVFDGVSSTISVPFLPLGEVFTFSKFVRSNDVTVQQRTGCSDSSRNLYFRLVVKDSKVEVYYHHDASPVLMVGSTTLVNDTYYHIAAVLGSNRTLKLYVNGKLEATQASGNSLGLPEVEDGFFIGAARGGDSGLWNGSIDQVEVYNRELTEEEIGYLFKQAIPSTALDEVLNYYLPFFSTVWSNRETFEQANPFQTLRNLGVTNDVSLLVNAGNNLGILGRDGEQRAEGFIEAIVTINKTPVANRRVLCFTNAGHLIAETRSGTDGVYRFDHLDLTKKYLLVAQDVDLDPLTDREYNAVAADYQLATPYED